MVSSWLCLVLIMVPFIRCNKEPFIGILTKPLNEEYPNITKEYDEVVEAKYVHFIEGGGGRAVAISYKWSEAKMQEIMEKLNGVLFVGGGVELTSEDGKELTEYSKGAQRVMNIAKKFNQKNDYFPVWGTCLGYELILILESNNLNLLKPCQCKNYNTYLRYNKEKIDDSRLFKKGFSNYLLDIMSEQNVTFNNHQWMVDDDTFNENKALVENYNILAHSPWKAINKFYIAAVEHKKYPIYAIQFHPEKYNYEYNPKQPVIRSRESITVSHGFANFFVNEARKSNHKFSTTIEAIKHIIQHGHPIFGDTIGYLYCFKY